MDRHAERRLIEKAAAGDRAAGEALVRAHQDSLYAYMLRMSGRPDVAEDIVQEAFVRVFTHLDRFDPRFRFSTWLFTIAKRLYVNACQKHRPVYDSGIVEGQRGDWDGPFRLVADDEIRTRDRGVIDALLGRLSAEQREIVALFHQLNWPIARISEHLGMPEGTVKSHLHRARRRMRTILEEDASARAERGEALTP